MTVAYGTPCSEAMVFRSLPDRSSGSQLLGRHPERGGRRLSPVANDAGRGPGLPDPLDELRARIRVRLGDPRLETLGLCGRQVAVGHGRVDGRLCRLGRRRREIRHGHAERGRERRSIGVAVRPGQDGWRWRGAWRLALRRRHGDSAPTVFAATVPMIDPPMMATSTIAPLMPTIRFRDILAPLGLAVVGPRRAVSIATVVHGDEERV